VHNLYYTTDPYHDQEWDGLCTKRYHEHHNCVVKYQVIPISEESEYCFDTHASHCDAGNILYIATDSAYKSSPKMEPADPPTNAVLLYTMYNDHAGSLTLVFDRAVIANNLDRIHLIHNIDTYLEDGTAPSMGGAELHTVDNKRQSVVLVFALPDGLRLAVTESLRTHGDLALLIDTRAIYSAKGHVDVTGDEPTLVPDIMVVR
jgi:hypothetical protein